MDKITAFNKKYAFLSNSHIAEFEWDGRTYLCCEAAFQSARSLDAYDRKQFTQMKGIEAKREGKELKLRRDWDLVKNEIMEEVVLAKFTQNPDLAKKLKETGDAELVYGNRQKETYWGVDETTGKGENHLGKILMKVRAILCDENAQANIEKMKLQKASEKMKQRMELQVQLNQVREQLKELPRFDMVKEVFYFNMTGDAGLLGKNVDMSKFSNYSRVTIDRRDGSFLIFKHRGMEKRVALPGCIIQGILIPENEEIRKAYHVHGMLLEYQNRLEKILEAME